MVKGFSLAEQKDKALKISIREGSANSVSSNLGDMFVTPLATEITSSANQGIVIGLLSSFSVLLSQLFQLKGSGLIKKHPRKSIVLTFVLIQAFLWLPIAALCLFVWAGYLTGIAPIILIILYSLTAVATGLHYPAWFSWMGDLIPARIRGAYFSKRNLVIGIVGLIAALAGSFLLKDMRAQNLLMLGFSIIFFFAFVFRLISYSYLRTQYAPPGGYKKERTLSFMKFVKKYRNFTKFSVYQGFFNFAVMVASPFFAVYMLEELNLKANYSLYMIITISSTIFYLIFLPLAGKFSDKYGNLILLYIANFAFVLTPILWVLSKNPIYLLFAPQITSGIGNAALAIAVTNFTYASVSNHHRGIGSAYSNIFIGIGTFVGAILGGLLLKYIQFSFIDKFFFVFLIAAALRLLVALVFLPQIKEIKTKYTSQLHLNIESKFKTANLELHHFNDLTQNGYSQGLKVWKPH